MNNLRLSFSGAELSRLRTLVTAVGKEIGLVPGGKRATAGSQTPMTALEVTWSNLLAMLDLGSEPEVRECPECKRPCVGGTTRCGHCWAVLPALGSTTKTSA